MKPLVSLKILDLTEGNPYIGSLFADYGAELIKVEKPHVGDSIRRRGAQENQQEGIYSDYYMRGKKSVAIDYTKAGGAELIKKIVAKVDMVVVNEADEKMSSFGLGYETLKSINSKLVYGVLTAFGEKGPWKDYPNYDLIAMARCGLLDKTGFPEKPTKFGFPLAMIYSSWHLTAGMLAAYLRVCSKGEGCKVSASMWHSMMSVDDTFAECLQALNVLPKRLGNGFPTTNPTDTFECIDGYFALSIGSDYQWLSFAKEAGRDDWGEGSIYAHDPARSMEHYFGDLDQQLSDYFKTITLAQADQICRNSMVPGAPCNTVKELIVDEQVAIREMIIDVNGAKQFGIPAKFSKDNENDNIIEPSHKLGEDTQSVLQTVGVDETQYNELHSEGIL